MRAGDNPRFVVTSLEALPPPMLYEDLYCARGNCENAIKAVKVDLHRDRTLATTFLANARRLGRACAASSLHHALRTPTLQHTALAQAQPSTVILTLFKITPQIQQSKDRILLHLPSSCPVKALTYTASLPCCAPSQCRWATRRNGEKPARLDETAFTPMIPFSWRLDVSTRGVILAIDSPLLGEVRALTAANHACPTRRGSPYRVGCPKNAFTMVEQARDALQNVPCYCL